MLSTRELPITIRDEGPCTVVAVGGELDVYSALLLRTSLLDAIASGRTCLVLDLSTVDVLDFSALRVLTRVRRRLQVLHGSLDIVVARPVLAELFRVTALDRVFALHASVDAALAAHRKPATQTVA